MFWVAKASTSSHGLFQPATFRSPKSFRLFSHYFRKLTQQLIPGHLPIGRNPYNQGGMWETILFKKYFYFQELTG